MSGSIFIRFDNKTNEVTSFALSTVALTHLHIEVDKALSQSMGKAWTGDAEIEWLMTQIDLCDLGSDNFMIAFEAVMKGCNRTDLLTDIKEEIKQAFEADPRFNAKKTVNNGNEQWQHWKEQSN